MASVSERAVEKSWRRRELNSKSRVWFRLAPAASVRQQENFMRMRSMLQLLLWCLVAWSALITQPTAGFALDQIDQTVPVPLTERMPHPLIGHWDGTLVRDGAELRASLDFESSGDRLAGTFSSPTQRALGIPLEVTLASAGTVRLVLDGAMIFEGQIEGDTFRGAFKERDGTGTFLMRRLPFPALPYRIEEVQFRNGATILSGSLFIPRSGGPHPAVVFNHGSGPEGRFASRFFADVVARRGLAALIYDKRGVGASTGDWTRARFEDLADDAIAGVQFLQNRSDVRPREIGIYGHSQGGTIAPLIATRASNIAFVIAAAAIGMPVYEQDLFRTNNELRAAGLNGVDLEAAMDFYRQMLEALRTGNGRAELAARTIQVQREKWFRLMGLPPDGHWLWQWYPPVGNYNSLPHWERVTVPVLLVYGELDDNTPVHESILGIERALKRAGNTRYSIVVLPRAAHNLTVQRRPGEPFEWWHVAPGYAELIADWILGRTAAVRAQ